MIAYAVANNFVNAKKRCLAPFLDRWHILPYGIVRDKMNDETITIICDNEDCRMKYILSMDTLRAVSTVNITCKNCGETQQVKLTDEGGIEIYHVK